MKKTEMGFFGSLRYKAQLLLIVLGLIGLGTFSSHESRAAPGTGTLYGTDAFARNLIIVDTSTGIGTVVGFMGGSTFPSLAVDPTTGVMYAAGGSGGPLVFTVAPGSGATNLVGDSLLGFAAIGGMDFRSDGTLFGAVNIAGDGGTGSDHLATIDKTTGIATVIGPFGTCTGISVPSSGFGSCTLEGMEGIAFDASGTLWGVLSARGAAGAPGLYTIDSNSGAATFVAPILDATGAPPSGGLVSIQFACDGTLFGGTARALPGLGDGGFLVTVDTTTGLFSFVGGASATGGSSLGGLAFDTACEEEPTAIDLASFEVEASDGQAIVIWETATEIDNAGFNIFRASSSDGPWAQVNSVLIAAEGDPVTGAQYTFIDTPGRGTFYYRLEDIDFFGLSTIHEPALVEMGAAIRIPWFRPSLPSF